MNDTKSRRRHASAWIALGLCAVSLFAPSSAFADASCTGLFERARKIAAASAQNDVQIMWTTNYFIPDRDARFMGTTQITLKQQGADLFGTASRDQAVVSLDAAKAVAKRTDKVSLRIRQDGKLMFNDMYGPYDPSCTHGKFAVVNGGDSIEVFSLHPRVKIQSADTVTISGAIARINRPVGRTGGTTGISGTYSCECSSGAGACSITQSGGLLVCHASSGSQCKACQLATSTGGIAPPTSIQ
jgi:hypothetical protein